MVAYGGVCPCGESDIACLTIDHINDDGATERKKMGYRNKSGGGEPMYRWLRRFGFPRDKYQLLCFNCQWKKKAYGPGFLKAAGA